MKQNLRMMVDERPMVLSSLVTFSAPCDPSDLGANDSFIKLSKLLDP